MSERDSTVEVPPGVALHYNEAGEWVKSVLPRKVGPGLVYFVQGKVGTPVKIGFTSHNDVTSRIKTLQTSNPYVLHSLLEIPGTIQDERSIHKALAPQRLVGEWFEWTGRTVQLVEMLVNRRPLPEALAAIHGLDQPHCPEEWSRLYTAESNVRLVLGLPYFNTLSKARLAGTGPQFAEVSIGGGRTGRYYRLSDLKAWLVSAKIPHQPDARYWRRLVFEMDPAVEEAPACPA